jgi:hypothetical protein
MTVFGSLRNPEFDSGIIVGNYTEGDLKKIASTFASTLDEDQNDLRGFFNKTAAQNFIKDPVGTVEKMTSIEKEAFVKFTGLFQETHNPRLKDLVSKWARRKGTVSTNTVAQRAAGMKSAATSAAKSVAQ